ncbi:SDR family oxidoreductase [Aquisediminimonas profunda]|uniref:SDR family oxidoreductase n=1 Tax=Aquisediminimonas profunda TaxID=1550733 RepID=UPI001C627651|nr:SDR family oxidoreductase [Aquisediminimonas profunda]
MKLALVTGGFRRLGAAIAARLASEGWTLALHCRETSEPDHDLAAILALHQTQWQGFACDLSDGVAVTALLPRIVAHFGQVPELIVNNASRFVADDFETLSYQELAVHMAVNLSAPVLLATGLAAQLAPGRTGVVINITDQRVRQPNGDQLSYTLAKQALSAATTTLAKALAPRVRVNAVAPGLTLPTEDYRPAQMVALEAMMPLERLPEPDQIADAVLWLANAEAVTGQTIYVDGGASLKSFERDFVYLGSADTGPNQT